MRECSRSLAELPRAALQQTELEEQPDNIPGRPRPSWKRASSAAPFYSTNPPLNASWGFTQHLSHTEAKGSLQPVPAPNWEAAFPQHAALLLSTSGYFKLYLSYEATKNNC